MAQPQNHLNKGNFDEQLKPGVHGQPLSAAGVAQPLSTSAPLASRDALNHSLETPRVVGQQQDAATRTKQSGGKLLFPFLVSALVALALSAVLARGRFFAAEKEKPVLAHPLETDHQSLKQTLKIVDETARRLRNKLKESSAQVRESFLKLYTPNMLLETFTEEQSKFWCEKYVEVLKSQPIPEEVADEAERQEFALRNLLFTTIFRAAEIRLDHLNKLEELSLGPQIPSASSLDLETILPHATVEDKQDAVSFQQFTRMLERLGVVGVAQEGDSGPKVSSVLADDLANAVAIKVHYDSCNLEVLQEFETFLASAQQAMAEMSEEERRRIENMEMPKLDVPFPLSVLTQAVERTKLRGEAERLSTAEILNWREQWNDVDVSTAAQDVRISQNTMFSVALDAKHSAVEEWGYLENETVLSTHALSAAVFLL
ncbi:hypothetical protein, conserved [Eimeria brunetti]|uniref:Transmembrane protein n=1 Tax=Eimeria brunetti TaxID=51314 RepID=U6LV47_9EIME|nr:hypothetical protein, conserved [Eimeria brunetti]